MQSVARLLSSMHLEPAERWARVCVYSAATTMAMPEDSHVPHSHLAYHVRRIGEGGAPLHPVGRLDK